MIEPSFKKLSSEDVDDLCGLTLRVAFAIHVENWKWYKRPQDKYPYILLNKAPKKNRKLNEDIAYEIGDGRFVYKNIPSYENNLRYMFQYTEEYFEEYKYNFIHYIEKELHTQNHYRLLMASAEVRCRAILKFTLDEKEKKDE